MVHGGIELPEKNRAHIDYFDLLRLLAMCGVIFMHTSAELLQGEITLQWELLNICTAFAFTAVPLFLMMSGYLLCSSEKTMDFGLLLKKRLPRLIVPLAAWTVIAALRVCILDKTLTPQDFFSKLADALSAPIAVHFWYMYLMIALYALSPLLYSALRGLSRRGHCYVLALIGLVTLQAMLTALLPDSLDKFVSLELVTRLRIFDGHLCTFLLGYYLGRTERRIPNRVLVPLILGLWALIAGGTHVLTRQNGALTSAFMNQSAGFEVALAACLFLFFKQNVRIKLSPHGEGRALVALGLPIYLMHNVLLAVFHDLGHYPAGIWAVARLFLLNLALCYLALKTAATIPFLCYPLTGMPFRQACLSCNWIYTWHSLQGFWKRRRAGK